jgi:hypothetical protein
MRQTRFDLVQREIASWTVDQVVLRLAVVIAPVIAICAAFASASSWSPWLLLLVVVGSVDCATQTESNLGLLMILLLAWHWGITVDDLRTPWTLVAALALGVFHTAMAAAASVPSPGHWSNAMRIRWLRRFGVVAAITLASWLAQVALAGSRMTGNGLLLFVALVALTATTLLLRAGALSRR